MVETKKVIFHAEDNWRLVGTLYQADHPNHRVILIASATGVKRRFYDAFANYVADSGYTVLTFDYRGIGDSFQGKLSRVKATLSDWGRLDLSAAIRWLGQEFPDYQRMAVLHSIGGVVLGLCPLYHELKAAVMVASPSFYWRIRPANDKWRVWMQINLSVPLMTRLLGYFPASKVGLGEDLPAGTMLEWCRWGHHPLYARGLSQTHYFDDVCLPMRMYSFSDDTLAPYEAVLATISYYPHASIQHKHFDPADIGLERIDHMGFFRCNAVDSLWHDALSWLNKQ